ncbi:MAG: hypothetical protein JWP37_1191 [Mucilaginibacter sp.]|nr:hypothetical protein [Mucilaginibacter sp.]
MKRILLILLLIIAGSFQLKAQVKTTDKFQDQKLNDSILLKGFSALTKLNRVALIPGNYKNAAIFYSKMPVAALTSVDRMGIAKLGDSPNNHYSILIKRYKVVDPSAVTGLTNP